MKFTKIILLFVTFLSLQSCDKNQQKEDLSIKENLSNSCRNRFPDFREKNWGLGRVVNRRDTLKIIVEFYNCGENNEHKECISLQRNKEDKVIARFIADSVSCNCHIIKNDSCKNNPLKIITFDKTKLLSNAEEMLFNLFLHRLFEIYLNKEENDFSETNTEYFFVDAGTSIQIINSDSTLNLNYWNIDNESNTWYGKIRKYIFGINLDKNALK